MHIWIWVDGQVVYAGGAVGGRQQTQFLQRKVLPMCTKDKNNNKIQGLNKINRLLLHETQIHFCTE